MIELVKDDKIGVIIAKSMSRIGRNYLEVGICINEDMVNGKLFEARFRMLSE